MVFSNSRRFLQVILLSTLVSGCNTTPVPNYKGEDAATLMFTMITSSGVPPTLSLRRTNEQKIIEVLYDSEHDKAYALDEDNPEIRMISIVRQIPPGEYLIVGAGLGGAEGMLQAYKSFEPALPISLLAREVNYIGSYKVNLKIKPDAEQKTDGKVVTVTLSGLSLDFSMADHMSADLTAFAVSNPLLKAQKIRNATPSAVSNSSSSIK